MSQPYQRQFRINKEHNPYFIFLISIVIISLSIFLNIITIIFGSPIIENNFEIYLYIILHSLLLCLHFALFWKFWYAHKNGDVKYFKQIDRISFKTIMIPLLTFYVSLIFLIFFIIWLPHWFSNFFSGFSPVGFYLILLNSVIYFMGLINGFRYIYHSKIEEKVKDIQKEQHIKKKFREHFKNPIESSQKIFDEEFTNWLNSEKKKT